jgi:hypothetical protein
MPGPTVPMSPSRHLRTTPLAAAAMRAALLIAMSAAGSAAAQDSSPYYIGLSQSLSSESNLVRLRDGQIIPPGVSQRDTVSATALVAGLDQRISRQRVYGSVALRSSRFERNEQYNSQGYTLNLGLDWSTVERLSGSVGLSSTRTPRASVRTRGDQIITERNIETINSANAVVRVGLVTRWSAELAVQQDELRYSSSAADFREYTQRGASAGLVWRPGAATRLSLGLGSNRTEYPNLLPLADPRDVRERDTVNLGASWNPGGASRLDLRLSQGKVKHDRFTERDYSSTSGNATWVWRPGGRLNLSTRLSRDTGQDVSAITTAFTRTTDQLRLSADYALSAKVALDASAAFYRRSVDGTGLFVSGISGRDDGRNFSAGVRWAPLRNLSTGCSLATERRGTSSNPALSDAYSARTVSCFGQLLLR